MGRPQLFKRWIALSTGQIIIQWIMPLVSLILIQYIAIYLVDGSIQQLNNQGQKFISAGAHVSGLPQQPLF